MHSPTPVPPTVVLVHGAFTDASSWAGVIDLLHAAGVAVHAPAGFFAMSGGYEYPAFLGATGLAIGLAGPGRYSLDHLTGHVFDRSWVGLLAFVGSAAGAYGVVARRRHLVRLREERAAVEAEQQEGSGLS